MNIYIGNISTWSCQNRPPVLRHQAMKLICATHPEQTPFKVRSLTSNSGRGEGGQIDKSLTFERCEASASLRVN